MKSCEESLLVLLLNVSHHPWADVLGFREDVGRQQEVWKRGGGGAEREVIVHNTQCEQSTDWMNVEFLKHSSEIVY